MISIEDQIKYVPSEEVLLSKIVFDDNNPNKLTTEQFNGLEAFIVKRGFAVEVWLNKLDDGRYMPIDGEHRIRILLKHKVKTVFAKIFKVPYADLRFMRQVANKLSGVHDKAKDANEFKAIFENNQLEVFAQTLGKPLEDFQKILEKQFDINFDRHEIDTVPGVPEHPKSKIGEIYQLGPHKLMCGDATQDLDKLLQGVEPRLLFTDPPYGLDGYAGRSGKFEAVIGDDQDVSLFYDALPKSIPERYIWGNWFNIKNLEEMPRDVIIWKKNNFGMGAGYRGQYEICLYFGHFKGSDSDVWEVAKDNVSGYQHPTQKPVKLAIRAIKNSTNAGQIVLDCYMGSGSTLIACEQTDRICYGMEIDPGYIDVIIQRWENFTNQKAVKI